MSILGQIDQTCARRLANSDLAAIVLGLLKEHSAISVADAWAAAIQIMYLGASLLLSYVRTLSLLNWKHLSLCKRLILFIVCPCCLQFASPCLLPCMTVNHNYPYCLSACLYVCTYLCVCVWLIFTASHIRSTPHISTSSFISIIH